MFSSNGGGFYFHDKTVTSGNIETEISNDEFPSPEQLWEKYKKYKGIEDKEVENVVSTDYFLDGSGRSPRYYQQIAINRTIEAVAKKQDRILLVMAQEREKLMRLFKLYTDFGKVEQRNEFCF